MASPEPYPYSFLVEDQKNAQMLYVSGSIRNTDVCYAGYSLWLYSGEATDSEMTLDLVGGAGYYRGSGIVADLPRHISLGGLGVYSEDLIINHRAQPFVERGWFNQLITRRRYLAARALADFEVVEAGEQVTLLPKSLSVLTLTGAGETLYYDPSQWEE